MSKLNDTIEVTRWVYWALWIAFWINLLNTAFDLLGRHK